MSKSVGPFSLDQWYAMCDVQMSRPIPLAEANLTQPFIYCRQYGVFYVGGGRHIAAMTLLLAFQHGELDGVDVAKKLKLEYGFDTSEYWIENTPGAAFLSSVSKTIEAFAPENLNDVEQALFSSIRYLKEL